MTKVKQRRSGSSRAVTGHRKGTKARGKTQAASKKKNGRVTKPKGALVADEAPRTVRVRVLDPQAKCGARTSVERLFRVDETVKGGLVTHLVFFDRHGLYCEHGRTCPAVDDVRRAHKNLDWTR